MMLDGPEFPTHLTDRECQTVYDVDDRHCLDITDAAPFAAIRHFITSRLTPAASKILSEVRRHGIFADILFIPMLVKIINL